MIDNIAKYALTLSLYISGIIYTLAQTLAFRFAMHGIKNVEAETQPISYSLGTLRKDKRVNQIYTF